MTHPMADDAIVALALAAWWRLRHSAHLLPHLRQAGLALRHYPHSAPWAAAITSPGRFGVHREQHADVRATRPVSGPVPSPASGAGSTTAPIPVVHAVRPVDPPTCPTPVVRPQAVQARRPGTPPMSPGAGGSS